MENMSESMAKLAAHWKEEAERQVALVDAAGAQETVAKLKALEVGTCLCYVAAGVRCVSVCRKREGGKEGARMRCWCTGLGSAAATMTGLQRGLHGRHAAHACDSSNAACVSTSQCDDNSHG